MGKEPSMKSKKHIEEQSSRRTLRLCYVCGRKVTGTPIYIGQDKWRHHRCEPGSARWLASKQAEVSEVTKYFVEERR